MENEIVIVSGLPRSGTSLMMQMLDKGGLAVITDNIRTPDSDNPRGYYELEQVKRIKEDVSWLPATRGTAFKMVSQLLYELPANEKYRVIFMERDLDEMILSQEKMLARLGKPSAPSALIKDHFIKHLAKLKDWLAGQRNIQVIYVRYSDLVERPEVEATRVSEFLDRQVEPGPMAKSVDPSLYRNRKT